MIHIRDIIADLLRSYRARVEDEVDKHGGFQGPVLPAQREASAQLEWLDNRDEQEPLP
jgi:hypothetical protein